MATRYWRGGGGTWSTTTTNWASTSTAATFTASRSAAILNVTAVASGTIAIGQTVRHTNNTSIGTITAFGSGTGGIGTYTMSASGTVTSRTMSSATTGASAPTASDDVIFDANSNTGTAAFTVTIGASAACRGLTISGLDATMTLAGTTAMSIAGSLSLPLTNLTRTYTGALTFTSASAATITTNGVSLASNLLFSGAGPFTLGSALSTTGTLAVSGGVTFNSANYSIASSTPNLGGTVSLGTSAYTATLPSSVTAILGGSVTGGTFTFNLNIASASNGVLGLGASVSGVVIAGSGSGTTFRFQGSNAGTGYTNYWGAVSSTKTVAHTVLFEEPNIEFFAGGISPLVQHNFTNFNLSGVFGNQLTLGYYTGVDGSLDPATLVQTSGTVSVSYDTISNLNGSGGASWRAYTSNGNVDAGSNIGWLFAPPTHATSGVLAGQGSTVVGAADRQSSVVNHATTGVLTGQGADVTGAATRSRAFDTAGALTGQGSTVVGAAARFKAFDTTGVLVGPGAIIVGVAAITVTHQTTGVLVGPGSIVVGAAEHTGEAPVSGGGSGSPSRGSKKGWARERAIYEASLLRKPTKIAELEQIRQALAKDTQSQRLARKLVTYDGDLEELASLQKELAKLQVGYKNKAEQSKELKEASAALSAFLLDEEDAITALMAMQDYEARQILAVLGINIH